MSEGEVRNQTIIVAPHPDDEIIGCYEKLKDGAMIIFDGDTEAQRRQQVLKLNESFKNLKILFQKSIPQPFLHESNQFYFPDHVHETHPLHRQWGMMGELIARQGFDVIFYSTIMNAPYIREVKEPEKKKELLNMIYPDQSDLWKYDHKYYLFEGHCKWIF